MENPELSICIGELIGVPRVTLRGYMDGWHDQAISGVLDGFCEEGTATVVLDLAGLTFVGIDGATAMINVLRSVGPGLCVHIVASGATSNMLSKANFGPCIRLYSSTDEIAEYIAPHDDYLTSRWLPFDIDDRELPLAA